MPSAVRIVLTALSWLSLPLTASAVAGVWLFTGRGEMLACAGMAATASAWSLRYVMCRVEEMVTRHQDRAHDRQAALIRVIDAIASGPTPAEGEQVTELHAAA